MKKFFKWTGFVVAAVMALALLGFAYVYFSSERELGRQYTMSDGAALALPTTRSRSSKAAASRNSRAACIVTATISPARWWTTFPNLVRARRAEHQHDRCPATPTRSSRRCCARRQARRHECVVHAFGDVPALAAIPIWRASSHFCGRNPPWPPVSPRKRNCARSAASSSPRATSSRRRAPSNHRPRPPRRSMPAMPRASAAISR